jgi:hypothetical protein
MWKVRVSAALVGAALWGLWGHATWQPPAHGGVGEHQRQRPRAPAAPGVVLDHLLASALSWLPAAGVQPYIINNAKVLFLRPRPQPRAPKVSAGPAPPPGPRTSPLCCAAATPSSPRTLTAGRPAACPCPQTPVQGGVAGMGAACLLDGRLLMDATSKYCSIRWDCHPPWLHGIQCSSSKGCAPSNVSLPEARCGVAPSKLVARA